MNKVEHNIRHFQRQNKRKEIDTFVNLNDSRFEPIDKSPKCMTNVKKVTGLHFKGYERRGPLFPEQDQATFYDTNKEFTMKGLKVGALPWKRMTNRPVVFQHMNETPEESYDHMKAVEVKTHRNKPRSVALADFAKTKSRDEMLLTQTDAFANVALENTKEEREVEI